MAACAVRRAHDCLGSRCAFACLAPPTPTGLTAWVSLAGRKVYGIAKLQTVTLSHAPHLQVHCMLETHQLAL